MSKQFRIALLGAGRWGVNLLRNFLAHPRFEVATIRCCGRTISASSSGAFDPGLASRI
jgi:predicted dehydrogenase